jgi:hypothetical protein
MKNPSNQLNETYLKSSHVSGNHNRYPRIHLNN